MKATPTPKPVVDHTKNVVPGPIKIVGAGPTGRLMTWIVQDATAEEIAARTAAADQKIRLQRDLLLGECDWTQLIDVPVAVDKAAWATYRQALRDVPQQPEFPWKFNWPTKP